jgi:hypothetical protein
VDGTDETDEAGGGWLAPSEQDRYNGKVFCRDGRAVWVIPRLHARSGWAVEIRDLSPDGPIVHRTWRPHRWDARGTVDRLRAALSGTVLDDVADGSVPLPTVRGIIVAHAARGGSNAMWYAALDDGPRGLTCVALWAEPGPRAVRWTVDLGIGDLAKTRSPAELSLDVDGDTIVHVDCHRDRPLVQGGEPPRFHHRCRGTRELSLLPPR